MKYGSCEFPGCSKKGEIRFNAGSYTAKYCLLHYSEKYRQHTEEVFNRDGWKCQGCGKSPPLQVHHKIKRSQGGSLTIENGISVCPDCHEKEHRG